MRSEKRVKEKYELVRAIAKKHLFLSHVCDINGPAFIRDPTSITELMVLLLCLLLCNRVNCKSEERPVYPFDQ